MVRCKSDAIEKGGWGSQREKELERQAEKAGQDPALSAVRSTQVNKG